MKKINTASSLAKIDKAEKEVAKLTTFLKTTSGQKFVNNIHKERIDVLCKRYHLDYIVYTNLTTTMNVVNSVVNKLGLKPENNAREAVEKLTEQHHPQPKRLTLHTRRIIKDGKIERIKSEISKLNIKIDASRKLTHKELLNGYKAHKLDKWLVKNPEPIEQDSTGQLNMFYESSHADWKKNLDGIKIKIEDQIIRKYNPCVQLLIFDNESICKKIVHIPDEENNTRNIRYIEENSIINILAKKEVYDANLQNKGKIAYGLLYDHNNKYCKRINISHANPLDIEYVSGGLKPNMLDVYRLKNPLFNSKEKIAA